MSSRGIRSAVGGERAFDPIHVFLSVQQAIYRDKSVVGFVAQEVAGRRWQLGYAAWRRLGLVREFFERPIERRQYAIELNSHLHRQRPSSVVIRRRGRRV